MNWQAKAVACLVVLAAAFGAGWTTRGWRADATMAGSEKAWAEAIAFSRRQSLQRYEQLEKDKDVAIKAAEQRAAKNRADADLAAAAADGLRKQIAGMPGRIAAATRAAVDEYAATAGELLGACTAEYQRLAGKADGHAADARLMQEAWPVNR